MPISILRELDLWYEKYFTKNPPKKHDFGFEITIFPFKLHGKFEKIYCTKLYGVTVLESMPISILRELDMWYETYFCEKPKNKKHDFGFEITIFPFKKHDKFEKINCKKTVRRHSFGKYTNISFT